MFQSSVLYSLRGKRFLCFRSKEQETRIKDRTKNGSGMPLTARITTGKVYVLETNV